VRLALGGGLLAASLALCACSSPSVPSWTMAGHKGQYLIAQRTAQRSHQKKMYVTPTAVHPKATSDGSYIGGLPNKSEYFEPGSEEWQHAQEMEQRRFDSLLAICRGC
jgi:hypothetical protein